MAEGLAMVFAKAPVPGLAKTRLIPALGPDGAAELHRRLLLRTLETVREASAGPLELWCTPSCEHPVFAACEERFGLSLRLQEGEDLGQRMQNAFSAALKEHPFAVLLGSDCASLEADILEQAFDALAAGQDAVIAPAEDGGYVLLGLRRVDERLFTGVPWGDRVVAALTRSRMRALGWRYLELPHQWDVDIPADLVRVAGLLE